MTPPTHTWREWAPILCDRHRGIGADGLLLLSREASKSLTMRVINADGSEPEMCGNGLRCAIRDWERQGQLRSGDRVTVRTGAGVRWAQLTAAGAVRLGMGHPRFQRADIPIAGPAEAEYRREPWVFGETVLEFSGVSLGNPHIVAFTQDLAAIPLEKWGPRLENDPLFPTRINIEIAQVNAPNEVSMRVWERGAGLTQACGTGACAVAITGIREGLLQSPVLVHMPGGSVTVDWEDTGEATLTGPAAHVYSGEFVFDQFPGPPIS